MTFSYGRALQAAALQTWAGDKANVERAQSVFAHRARATAQARCGMDRLAVAA
jgi:fructose-bisphosphate aldolase class I